MNGPQRTACLAKGWINNQYQLTIPMRGQLNGYIPGNVTYIHVNMRCQTRHTQTDGRTEWQLAILSLAGSQNFCQTIKKLSYKQMMSKEKKPRSMKSLMLSCTSYVELTSHLITFPWHLSPSERESISLHISIDWRRKIKCNLSQMILLLNSSRLYDTVPFRILLILRPSLSVLQNIIICKWQGFPLYILTAWIDF